MGEYRKRTFPKDYPKMTFREFNKLVDYSGDGGDTYDIHFPNRDAASVIPSDYTEIIDAIGDYYIECFSATKSGHIEVWLIKEIEYRE